jgi:hypothetical protein
MALSVTSLVTRDSLGLSALNINDHTNFILGAQIMGGTVAWERNQVSSPWVDGDITISRRRPNVQENLQVNILGSDQGVMLANIQTIVEAFTQDEFVLTIGLDGNQYWYGCEAADYSIEWGIKMHSNQCMVTFMLPRKPIALAGA